MSKTSSFGRDAWLEINLSAIEYNYKQIKANLSDNAMIMAILKSDAYGHGVEAIAPLLQACNCNYFGVASVEEGIELRNLKIHKPILILSPLPVWAIKKAIHFDLEMSISSLEQVKRIEEVILSTNDLISPIKIQIKINTGMNRGGAKYNTEAENLIQYILTKPNFFLIKGIYTHLSNSIEDNFSQVQLSRFRQVLNLFADHDLGLRHVGASSSINHKEYHFDMVRIGLSLYGLGENRELLGLKPVLSLLARISHLQKIETNEGVGYNLTWRAKQESLIGLLPLGYADGIKRGLSNKICGIFNKHLIKQVGTISMDQMSFDFSDHADSASIGDKIILIGKNDNLEITLKDWADKLNTIEYEISCDLRMRLPKVFVRNY